VTARRGGYNYTACTQKRQQRKTLERPYSTDSDLILWSDGSRLETGAVGAGIAWEIGQKWYEKGRPLGNTKEVSDAELYGIRDALEIAIRGGHPLRRSSQLEYPFSRVTVFLDSQVALKRAQSDHLGPG
jgi:hypothetical protein